ncbi:TIGR02449 family protein [Dyella sp.]|uniref:TIGR02449 family protein n=1 Tax=Dyella sp. TaxID=1869338 RepID=UPI002ED24F3D
MSTPEPLQSDAFRSDPIREQVSVLGERVDRLLDLVHRLQEENRSLRQSQEQLANERAGLMARNEQARSRVEAMIQRLKALEHSG